MELAYRVTVANQAAHVVIAAGSVTDLEIKLKKQYDMDVEYTILDVMDANVPSNVMQLTIFDILHTQI